MDSPVATTSFEVASRERRERFSQSLSDAARRLRFTTSGRASLPDSYKVRRAKRLRRWLTVGSFILCVAGPIAAATAYFGWLASNQYVAEARFAVRSGAFAGLDALASMTGLPSMQIIQDTQVVTNFIESRAMVEELQARVDLRTLYSDSSIDYFARATSDEPIEKFVRYWRGMNAVAIEMPGGIVSVVVRAFRPGEAVTIANAVVDSSESLVNAMNDRARQDSLKESASEYNRATDRLAAARAALETARNREGTLDASRQATKTTDLVTSVREQLLQLRLQYDAARATVSADAPQMRNLKSRVDAAERQVQQLQTELTQAGTTPGAASPLSGTITRLAQLELERQVAERQYVTATTALERARLSATSKQIYLTSFVRPVPAEEARYPRRVLWISLTLAVGLIAWGTLLGLGSVVGKRFR